MLGLYVGNIDRIGTSGEVAGDCEGVLLPLTSVGDAEHTDTEAGGGGGGGGEDRTRCPALAGVSLPTCSSRSTSRAWSLGGAICARGKGWILRGSSMICMTTDSAPGDLMSVCSGKAVS